MTSRRRNALTGNWVLVSEGRNRRPWNGATEDRAPRTARQAHDPGCYLCPGNTRANGEANPQYRGVWSFPNDFPALGSTPTQLEPCDTETGDSEPADGVAGHDLFRWEPAAGVCEVICYTEDHSAHLASMEPARVRDLVDAWVDAESRLHEAHRWVQIFENRGSGMGASSTHPHGQIWATEHLPTEAALEQRHQREWWQAHGTTLLGDYRDLELRRSARVVLTTSHWVAIVPYWATWPYELLLLPRADRTRLGDLDGAERDDLAGVMRRIVATYDALFDTEFPYSFGWHCAPAGPPDGWVLHGHFYPPLLRSAGVRKHMVGYELLAEAQRDLSPEEAAEGLREVMGEG